MGEIAIQSSIDAARLDVGSSLEANRKSELGQFMTPAAIATFMTSLFSATTKTIHLLDAGAGVGSLTSAFLDRFQSSTALVEAWEIDPLLKMHLADMLASYARAGLASTIHNSDFIEDAVWNISMEGGQRFTHAILNPPYRKIKSDSKYRYLLRDVGIETVNLYTAFLALAILLMEEDGEIVAIVPRSFCNGTYYRPFREQLLQSCAIEHIHVFEARNKAFSDDDVLQENIIVKLKKAGTQGAVTVSESHDATFSDYHARALPFGRIVKDGDAERFIHIPVLANAGDGTHGLFSHSLKELGIEVCTGPVVDFRLRGHCRPEPDPGTVPLIYAHHFSDGKLVYPKTHKKPNAILLAEETRKWLMPKGFYVLTKRFSSKEERRRVVAFVIDPNELPAPFYGFENHLNVFHIAKHGMDKETALGMALFLNSTVVDSHFRVFSGHTQVNATDLRQMRYPSHEQLLELGRLATAEARDQAAIDRLIKEVETRWQSK
ncbi:MAG: Eco57I restriction-modification methylase domain-containing protein [Gammaproteobacteria bacterium]|nr:Eco57I restriction-modification methylase domain-containing protein [Gammaproteobacteria bacterium]